MSPASCQGRLTGHAEAGQVTLLILGMAMVVVMLIGGTVAVTSAQLSRMRLLDAADGAALDAADSLDSTAYRKGLAAAVPVSDATVRQTAEAYLAERSRPPGVSIWRVSSGTGSPDGQSAVVRITGQLELPIVGGLLRGLRHPVIITVESRARADLR